MYLWVAASKGADPKIWFSEQTIISVWIHFFRTCALNIIMQNRVVKLINWIFWRIWESQVEDDANKISKKISNPRRREILTRISSYQYVGGIRHRTLYQKNPDGLNSEVFVVHSRDLRSIVSAVLKEHIIISSPSLIFGYVSLGCCIQMCRSRDLA